MLVKEAKAPARRWLIEETSRISSSVGVFFVGSINWMADDDVLPRTSDVDVRVVLARSSPAPKLVKFVDPDLLIEAGCPAHTALPSPDTILGHYHGAGSFAQPGIIVDPTGELTQLQPVLIARDDYCEAVFWITATYSRCQEVFWEMTEAILHPGPGIPA